MHQDMVPVENGNGDAFLTITFNLGCSEPFCSFVLMTKINFHDRRLKRLYILFNMKHGLNEYDKQMLAHLARLLLNDRGEQRFTLQAVITKADSFPAVDLNATLAKIKSDIWDAAPLCLPPIVTSAHMNPPFGIDALRQNIASVCNLR